MYNGGTMFERCVVLGVVAAAVLAAVAGLVFLFGAGLEVDGALRVEDVEGSLAEGSGVSAEVDLAGVWVVHSNVVPGRRKGEWSGFRGGDRVNIASGFGWRSPRVAWVRELGDGHAAACVSEGRVFVLDYDEARGGDWLRCLSVDSGAELWSRFYGVRTKRNHGISRTVCAAEGGFVVSLGPQCHVLCVRAVDGELVWGLDLQRRFGAKVPLWYAGQCPLIVEGRVILAPGSEEALLCGVDLASGVVAWVAKGVEGIGASHASVMVLEVEGVRQFVYAGLGGVVGVSESGEVLWVNREFVAQAQAPSPCILPGGRFFLTAGYGAGGALFEVARDGEGAWSCRLVYRVDKRVFGSEQQTPVFRDGLLFAVLPASGGGARGQFVCMRAEDGSVVWRSGAEDKFGLGPFVGIGRHEWILADDRGSLTWARGDARGFERLARVELMEGEGRDAWGPIAVLEDAFLVRDSTRLFCLTNSVAEGGL